MKFLKQLFCKHDWEIVRKSSMFFSLNGEYVINETEQIKEWLVKGGANG